MQESWSFAIGAVAFGIAEAIVSVMGHSGVFDKGPYHGPKKALVAELSVVFGVEFFDEFLHVWDNARNAAPHAGED